MATSNNDRVSSARLLDMLKGLQESRHLGSEPEVDPQTNEKTKHTIKQDYLPNADWNVNDPDADGYVQGRTHWVEHTVGDIPVTTEQGMSTIPDMVKPEGFKAGAVTWKPNFEATYFETEQGGVTMNGYMLCEDENGVPVTDFSSVMGDTYANGVVVADYTAFMPNTYAVLCKRNNQETQADYVLGVTEVVHQLPKKYYEQTDETALKNEIYDEVNSKFVYRQVRVSASGKMGMLLDNAVELESYLANNGFTKHEYDHYNVWDKEIQSAKQIVAIYRPSDDTPTYKFVAMVNKSDTVLLWNFLYTHVISLTPSYASGAYIASQNIKRDNPGIFYLADDYSEFESKTLRFNSDNTITCSISNANTNVGTIDTGLNITLDAPASGSWIVIDKPYDIRKNGCLYYYQNNKPIKCYPFGLQDESYNMGVDTSLTEIFIEGNVVKRILSAQLIGLNGNPLQASEEKTVNKADWCDYAMNNPSFNFEGLDELVGVHEIGTFEEDYGGLTRTNRVEYWIDSDYNFHAKNLESGRNIHVPRDFYVGFTWYPTFNRPMSNHGSYYNTYLS